MIMHKGSLPAKLLHWLIRHPGQCISSQEIREEKKWTDHPSADLKHWRDKLFTHKRDEFGVWWGLRPEVLDNINWMRVIDGIVQREDEGATP